MNGQRCRKKNIRQDTELVFDFNTLKAFSLKILPKHQAKYLFKTNKERLKMYCSHITEKIHQGNRVKIKELLCELEETKATQMGLFR